MMGEHDFRGLGRLVRFALKGALLLILVHIPGLLAADAYEQFPGFDALTSRSAAVAVVEILPEPAVFSADRPGWQPDVTGGHRDYNAAFMAVFKDDSGRLEPGTTTVLALRSIGGWSENRVGKEAEIPENIRVGTFNIAIGGRYLVFLDQHSTQRYSSVPAVGAVLLVPKELQLPTADADRSGDPIQAIRRLIAAAAASAGEPVSPYKAGIPFDGEK